MEKRSESRLSLDGAIQCTVKWEKGREEGRIHNISPRGALREAKSDFGISRIKLVLELDTLSEPLTLDAAIRWHAVSPRTRPTTMVLCFATLMKTLRKSLFEPSSPSPLPRTTVVGQAGRRSNSIT